VSWQHGGMCHSDDSVPPLPPRSGTVADQRDLHLTAGDGNRLMAYAARAGEPTGVGVVVLPDVRGLHQFYKTLVALFAGAGRDAVAIDYFGRTAGDGSRAEPDFDYKPLIPRTGVDGIAADVAAAVEYLRSPAGGAVRKVYTVGFCFGGAYSWRQSASGLDLAGCAGFYGRPHRTDDVVDRMAAPLLLLLAGKDFTPPEDFARFQERLAAAGVPFESVTYPDAPHSFFDRRHDEHREACADAWERVLAFTTPD
jgi:carboxymethylenebutenolidase